MTHLQLYILFGFSGLLAGIIFIAIRIRRRSLWPRRSVHIFGVEEIEDFEYAEQKVTKGDLVCFRLLASNDGSRVGNIYKSKVLCSLPDDEWLTGSVKGRVVELRYNPENSEEYSLILDNLPPSKYS